MRTPALLLTLLLALAAAGCGDDAGAGGRVNVVATTAVAGDLVRNVGGDRVDVEVLVPAGADPHDYDPRPSDAAALAEADLVVRSGGELDEWLGELIDSAGGGAPELSLLDSVRRLGEDPHWWHDSRNAALAVGAIRDALAEADPDARAAYRRDTAAYLRELRRLDADIDACMRRVPPPQRKLVTTHDALGYFAERYGVEVIGAVIPSLSTQAQPSARDVDELVEQIRREQVAAIFPEAAVSQRLERAISRESGAEVGRELWTDGLGGEGSGADTYVGAMRANADALAEGMSGGRVRCAR